jgi:hypothetical protein
MPYLIWITSDYKHIGGCITRILPIIVQHLNWLSKNRSLTVTATSNNMKAVHLLTKPRLYRAEETGYHTLPQLTCNKNTHKHRSGLELGFHQAHIGSTIRHVTQLRICRTTIFSKFSFSLSSCESEEFWDVTPCGSCKYRCFGGT